MEDGKWNIKKYASAMKELEKMEDDAIREDRHLRMYLKCLREEVSKEENRDCFSFLWDFSLPDEDDIAGQLLYASWAYRAYNFYRAKMPEVVMGTSSQLY